MEAPSSFRAEAVRDEKAKLFDAMRPLRGEDVVRGQYTGHGQRTAALGYLEEPGVAPESQTETYAALRLHIDNWRWAGVPFYLRTGKRLPMRRTEVVVTFREAPVPFFRSAGVASTRTESAHALHPAGGEDRRSGSSPRCRGRN